MAEKEAADTTASQKSIKNEAEIITEENDAIFVRKNPKNFQEKEKNGSPTLGKT